MTRELSIAVDARPLERRLTGIGQYTLHLLRQLTDLGHRWYLLSNTRLRQGEWNAKENVTCVHFNLRIPGAANLLVHTAFPRWCKKNTIDLYWSPRHHLPLILSRSIPAVVTVHDVVWKRVPETMAWQSRMQEACLMRYSVRRATAVIADSVSTKNDLIELLAVPEERINVVPLAATLKKPENFQDVLKKYGLGRPYILFIGTLEPRKNLVRLVNAFGCLRKSGQSGIDLVITGKPGWGGEDLQNLVREHGIVDVVHFLDYMDQVELAALLAGATLLAMPSLYEGFGLPLVDAMRFGVPILTSDRSSMPEVTGEAAVYVNPYEVDSIFKGMQQVLTDNRLREQLVQAGYRQAEQFSWRRAARASEQVFQQAVSAGWTMAEVD